MVKILVGWVGTVVNGKVDVLTEPHEVSRVPCLKERVKLGGKDGRQGKVIGVTHLLEPEHNFVARVLVEPEGSE